MMSNNQQQTAPNVGGSIPLINEHSGSNNTYGMGGYGAKKKKSIPIDQ